MLEKMLGVSPPQKGLAQDSKEVDKKLLQQPDLKKEFDQKLKAQLKDSQKEKNSLAKDEKNDQKPKLDQGSKDELKADARLKKPSGGPKKKVVESEEQDEPIISNVMASIESEVEIPDEKNLAPIESESLAENNQQIKASAFALPKAIGLQPTKDLTKSVVSADAPILIEQGQNPDTAALSQTEMAQLSQLLKQNPTAKAVQLTPEMVAAFRALQQKEEPTESTAVPMTELQQQMAQAQMPEMIEQASSQQAVVNPMSAMNVATMTKPMTAATDIVSAASLPTTNDVEGFDVESDAMMMPQSAQEQQLAPMQSEMMALPQQQENEKPDAAKKEELTFEQQLGAEVGFEPEDQTGDKQVSKSALMQKMKAFEAEKGLSPKEASAFELKVLNMLQQERNTLVHQKYSQGQGGSEFSQKDKQNDSGDTLKELKSALNPADGMLHAGQSQTDFRTHLMSPLERAAGVSSNVQMMNEHREENIQEVMKQAKFLVTKGGGEMVVKMSPDGMGPIALKVMMQDGKVNIEMQTVDKSVKKLIEDSLTELKSGLASQRIHVDHVKINTVNATNTENSAQFNTQHQNSDGQGRQQEFWQEFRQNFGNQSRRNSYADVQAVPGRQPTQPNALQPVKTSTARAAGRTGSTINRIA